MWHYRPETRRSEVFMKGLVNPWGHVFDEWGQSFMTDGAGGRGSISSFRVRFSWLCPEPAGESKGSTPGNPSFAGWRFSPAVRFPMNGGARWPRLTFSGSPDQDLPPDRQRKRLSIRVGKDLVASARRRLPSDRRQDGAGRAIYVADLYNPIIQHGESICDPRQDHKHGRIWRISFPENPRHAFCQACRNEFSGFGGSLAFFRREYRPGTGHG